MSLTPPMLRLDRLASLYFARPLMRPLLAGKKASIPILMYHSISENCEERIHPYYELNTSPRLFAEHMKYLAENKYAVITLDQVAQFVASGKNAPEHCVAITFDDGYRDFYTEAFPILQQHGFTATVFLPTNFIGSQRLKFKGKECLSWEEVRELHRQGIVFGSHTVTHPKLRLLKRAELENEIRQSKEIIEDRIGASVQTFSFPFAFPEQDRNFIKILKDLLLGNGYNAGVTTMIGRASAKDSQLLLRRIPVNNRDDLLLYGAKLQGAYDWVQILQRLKKRLTQNSF